VHYETKKASYRGAPEVPRESEVYQTRILVAFEDDYQAYTEALSKAIGAARPHLKVTTATLEALQREVARLDPHLVISNLPNPATEQEGKLLLFPAWVELSLDPHLPSKFRVDGRRWESLNPSLEELLNLVEEAEQLALSNSSKPQRRS
jgi:hypothetical protein